MTKKKEKYSKHYYEYGRNGYYPENYTTTGDTFSEVESHFISDYKVTGVEMSVPEGMEFNKSYPLKDPRIPDYYIGDNGYEARRVVSGFGLSYNIGTAVTYLLRAERKHNTPIDCIKKAIAHLEFELEKYEEQENNS